MICPDISTRTTYVILDEQDRIIAVLVGRPKEKEGHVEHLRWSSVTVALLLCLKQRGRRLAVHSQRQ